MKRRTVAFLMAVLLLAGCLFSCTGDQQSSRSEGGSSDGSAVAPESTTSLMLNHLGERNLDGFELVILSTTEEVPFGDIQFATDELNSDPVNDAVFERNI